MQLGLVLRIPTSDHFMYRIAKSRIESLCAALSHQPRYVFLVAALMVNCGPNPKKFIFSKLHKANQLIVSSRDQGDSASWMLGYRAFPGLVPERLNPKTILLTLPSDEAVDLEQYARKLMQDGRVVTVEPNYIYHISDNIPNDPDFGKLYAFHNAGESGGQVGADVKLIQAWEVSQGSRDVLIAVTDTGIDYAHQDLADNIWINPGESGLDSSDNDRKTNGIDDDGNGYIDDWHGWDFYNQDNDPADDNGHGTHVAGTIGAVGDNRLGVVGVNWKVSLVPVKVFSAGGEATTDVIIKGIDYATSLGSVASNNSWGGGGSSPAMLAAIKEADAKGSLFITAAGNEGRNNDVTDEFPSNYPLPNIISVAATDRNDRLAGYSNYGKRSVAAPGTDIWSTLPGNHYGYLSGTSMAAPHVTGLSALIKAAYPQLGPEDIKHRILASAEAISSLEGKVGFGRIHAASSLEHDVIPPAPVRDIEFLNIGERNLKVAWRESGDDGDEGHSSQYVIKMALSPIETEQDWDRATTLVPEVMHQQIGKRSAEIDWIPYNSQAYLSIRSRDNAGNWSPLSESHFFQLRPVKILLTEENVNQKNWESLGRSWGFVVDDGVSFLSDSPDGHYRENAESIAETKDFMFSEKNLSLDVRSRYEFEDSYDFAYVELSKDHGKSWLQLMKFTGKQDLGNTSVDLSSMLEGSGQFRLRFRTWTDSSMNGEGWDIDGFKVVVRRGE